ALKQLDSLIYAKIDLERQNTGFRYNEKISENGNYDIQLSKYNSLQKDQSKLNILSILINSIDRETIANSEKLSQDNGKEKEEITKMTDKQLRDEVMTIFLAGHETTANALTWTLYLLSLHPNIESKVLDELALLNKDNNCKKIIAVEDMPRLKYTENILMEAMRLYPPSWAIGRQALKDYPLNDRYIIPSGAVVIMSQYLMHHDARYFSDPEKFVPERWSLRFKGSIPRFSYFPFGGGPRSCIGEPLAWIESIIILANIINIWKIKLDKNTDKIKLHPLVTLRPKNGIRMKISKR
ncbi:MAG: cytochrome P450, partial [Thermoproteota archaeon]|nr:cytochrome P450 [Thermoproteota archaeon]